ncbi:MAG: MarR family transcriptional regulator [Myxococcales bacterium]
MRKPANRRAGRKPRAVSPARGSFSLRLDEQLCFALYSASRAVTAFYRPMLDALGLTYPQYLVLLVLWERGQCLVKDLASALELDYGTLSPLLKRLESAGLLRRQRRADDERSVVITLTDAGFALRARCEGLPSLVAGAMGPGLDGLTKLRAAIRRLGQSVAAAGRDRRAARA